jgi:hypothetical protein
MNKADRKLVAAAFRKAKKYLSTTYKDTHGDMIETAGIWKHEFICHCLDRALVKGEICQRARDLTEEIIYKRLRECGTLAGWIRTNHPELDMALIHDYNHNLGSKAQRTRKAWLNSLIAEFDK